MEDYWKKIAREQAAVEAGVVLNGAAPIQTADVAVASGPQTAVVTVSVQPETTPTPEGEKKKRQRRVKIVDGDAVAPKKKAALTPEEELAELNKNERYTLDSDIEWVKGKLGVSHFDLDVAACLEAHVAAAYYTKESDGLKQPWFPPGVMNVFCNPPWDDIAPWVKRAWSELATAPIGARLALVIPGNRTEQPFWHENVEPARDGRAVMWAPDGLGYVALRTDFFAGRTKFGSPGDPKRLNPETKSSSPPFTCVLLAFYKVSK